MYSPKIKPELVRKLYQYKRSRPEKKSMTFYANDAIEQYLTVHADKTSPENIPGTNTPKKKSHLDN